MLVISHIIFLLVQHKQSLVESCTATKFPRRVSRVSDSGNVSQVVDFSCIWKSSLCSSADSDAVRTKIISCDEHI